mmetsp:Transcript_148800/g.386907  ORF Transcript_148800/g.386907 Transcript_148800/m.386907 type:complete len:227 (+) Transcript_148800:1833-2513(+)
MRQASNHGSIILDCHVVAVKLSVLAQLECSKGKGAEECSEVHNPQEGDFGPHQTPLCLIAPCNENTIVTGRSELPRTEHPEVCIDERSEEHPSQSYDGGPNDECGHEVEVERHARTSDILLQQICGQRVQLRYGLIIECPELSPLSRSQRKLQGVLVRRRSNSHIDHPGQDKYEDQGKNGAYNIHPSTKIFEVALPIRMKAIARLALRTPILCHRCVAFGTSIDHT